jgi:hypothetical protein
MDQGLAPDTILRDFKPQDLTLERQVATTALYSHTNLSYPTGSAGCPNLCSAFPGPLKLLIPSRGPRRMVTGELEDFGAGPK